MDDNEWQVHNGCNACINKHVCDVHGNCILLSINQCLPENDKKKRKFIAKIRTLGDRNIGRLKQFEEEIGMDKQKQVAIADVPTVRLTKLEQMFIECLNKKR